MQRTLFNTYVRPYCVEQGFHDLLLQSAIGRRSENRLRCELVAKARRKKLGSESLPEQNTIRNSSLEQ